MSWLRRLVWTAVLSMLFCLASVLTGILGTDSNIWLPLGLAGITFALLTARTES